MKNIEIYTDGGCSVKTTKVGCWAYVVVLDGKQIAEDFGVVKDTTNGRMEVLALKSALFYALNHIISYALDTIEDVPVITIKSDSQYCVNAYNSWCKNWENNKWRKSNNKPVEHVEDWKVIHTLRNKNIQVEWVRGHDGNKWNEYVDKLTHNR